MYLHFQKKSSHITDSPAIIWLDSEDIRKYSTHDMKIYWSIIQRTSSSVLPYNYSKRRSFPTFFSFDLLRLSPFSCTWRSFLSPLYTNFYLQELCSLSQFVNITLLSNHHFIIVKCWLNQSLLYTSTHIHTDTSFNLFQNFLFSDFWTSRKRISGYSKILDPYCLQYLFNLVTLSKENSDPYSELFGSLDHFDLTVRWNYVIFLSSHITKLWDSF